MLYGWTAETWARVADWANESTPNIWDEVDWPRLLRLRERWLLAGGPLSGVSGMLVEA